MRFLVHIEIILQIRVLHPLFHLRPSLLEFDQFLGNLLQKPGFGSGFGASTYRTQGRSSDDEVFPRPGHADIEKTPLLMNIGIKGHRAGMRQQPLLQPHQEHHRKLQPLGAVEGHQADCVLLETLLLRVIAAIRGQARALEEIYKVISTLSIEVGLESNSGPSW